MAEKLSNRALKAIQNRPRRKVQAFLFCLIISVFIWFTRELSKDFTTTLDVPINYVDLPGQLMLYGENPTHLSVTITSAGFDIFGQSVLGRVGNINVSLSHLQGAGVTSFDEFFLQAQIASAISGDAELVSFAPKQFSIDIARRAIKKVPVSPNISATIEDPYFLFGDPISIPDSIEISGPKPVLDSIHFVATQLAEFAQVSDQQSLITRLALPAQVKSKTKEVEVLIQLDQWTERVLTVPIYPSFKHEELEMKTFPDSTEITCQLGLSEFETLVENDFRVEVRDYSLEELENEYKVFLEIVARPAKIRNEILTPNSVEFILSEKN